MNTPLQSKPKTLSKKKLDVIRSDMSIAHDANESSLLRRALFKTNNIEVSQDLVQATFLKTLLYLQKGGRIDLMRSFLNHVLGDLIVDEYRKNKSVSLDKMLEKGFEPGCTEYQRNSSVLDGKQAARLVPRLPKKYERVIELRYLKGLSLKEVSLVTGQSENTVAVQVHRGLQKLKVMYHEGEEAAETRLFDKKHTHDQ